MLGLADHFLDSTMQPTIAARPRLVHRHLLCGLFVAVAPTVISIAAPPIPNPDFTAGETIPKGSSHDWTLGPTGLRGWMHCEGMETTTARQILVTQVDKGSPADGVVAVGDVILGIGTTPFRGDPRRELGEAIGRAEQRGGRLVVLRWRDKRRDCVTIELPVLGGYSKTAPFGCKKSGLILKRGCEALVKKLGDAPDHGTRIERSYAALALLAGGNPKHLPIVKDQIARLASYTDPEHREYHSWFYGPITIVVAEYTIATGDNTFKDELERLALEIARGQSRVGSWGHRFVQTEGNGKGRLSGYGMMNATGIPMLIGLALAREAGIDHPEVDAAIERGARLVRFYVGKGSVPYGDHHPWIENHDDNGKNGAAAILFNILGDVEAAEYFSRMSVACHGVERDTGHTGNYFNMFWAMPGVALSGPNATGAWLEEFGWSFDLARRWDGTFTHQGPAEPRYDCYRMWDASGCYLLAYAQGLGRLHLSGLGHGRLPQVDRHAATGLVDDGRGWSPRTKLAAYEERADREILAGLESWSPVVRERSAIELARRGNPPITSLRRLLERDDPYAVLGACQAAIQLKKQAAPLLSELRDVFESDDLWTRVKAAEAIAAIGPEAMPLVPMLLARLAALTEEDDVRGMERRYLCFALFDHRDGMLGRSLDGVDRSALAAAVEAGLRNEDGRARGTIGSVYSHLTYEEIEPLLPLVLEAVVEPAPSGIMFADGIRLAGLEILARHRIAEGLPLCLELVDPGRWGWDRRIERCLSALRQYSGAAKPLIPQLFELQRELIDRKWEPKRLEKIDIPGIVKELESAPAVELRSLTEETS